MVFSSRFSLTYRDILAGLLVMLLAFMLRVVVTFERAADDSAFAPLPDGTDQQAYVGQAELYEAGTWPTEPFYWQPGLIYFLVGMRALVGYTIGQMTLGMALVSALGCGLVVAIGWLVTRRRWGGYLAGLLMAIYPPAIFYATTLLSETLGTFYIILFLFLVLWQREKLVGWRSALIGLALGLLTITRTNLAAVLLAWMLLLWLDTRTTGTGLKAWMPRMFVIHMGISLLFMALMIAPVTLWNINTSKNHEFVLVTATGNEEMYRGNNRDATGQRSTTPAMSTTDDGYMNALISDVRRDPLHFVELQLRKAGLYWSAAEPGNNVDYVSSGEAVSPLLRTIPMDFLILAFVGWLGLLFLFEEDRRTAAFLIITHLGIFSFAVLIWTEGRVKEPSVPLLTVTMAYVLVRIGEWAAKRFPKPSHIGRYAFMTGALLLVFGGLGWSADNLPQQRPVGSLPADLRSLDVTFDSRLKLVGWRTLPEWPAAERGWSHFQRSYVIQLYWQVLENVPDDYNLYLAYVQNGARLAGVDRAIGTVSFRPKPTSAWSAGDIYSEIIGFYLPQDLPRELDGDIRLGVYKAQGEVGDPNRTIKPVAATSLPDQPDSIVLQRLAIFDTGYVGSELPDFTASEAVFSDQIALKGFTMPEKAQPGENISIGLYWKALTEINRDYTVFLHVEDQSGKLVTQADSAPRGNTLVTSTWPPDYPIADEMRLTMPDTPGLYHVYIGMYDSAAPDYARLFASTSDGRWLLGEIAVQ